MKNNPYVFRASFTYMNLWASGRWEEAINAYFKINSWTTRAMAEGKDFHDDWEKESRESGKLPQVFGGAPLNNPIFEQKYEIPLTDWMTLVMKADCIDSPILHEYKTGVTSASDYAETYQPAVYAVGCTFKKIYIDRVYIHAYNQHVKKSDFAMVWVTKKLLSDGMNWIETVASEMHSYFMQNDLYDRLAKKDV